MSENVNPAELQKTCLYDRHVALKFVNWIFTNEIRGFEPGKVLYGMMCYPEGGVVDDLLVYREFAPEHFLLVVNAANIDKDFAWIEEHAKGFDCVVRNESRPGPRGREGGGRGAGPCEGRRTGLLYLL